MTGPAAGGWRLAAASLLLSGLAACGGPDAAERLLARQQAVDPPHLWRIEVVRPDGAPGASTYICADSSLAQIFTRTRAEINGAPCLDVGGPAATPDGWSLRCQVDGRLFSVGSAMHGDRTRDFRLDFALVALDREVEPVKQSQHFQRLGPCPAGWGIGDQARPGRRPQS
ncbi:hypothetical protein [Phenylobacterium sp.]|uniref:hypothetical protein n=1 Tax=Phenylobacterium sp. TaxID=1871053 RepID=UPI001211E69B|nr:hypothetical protein [Phenylobacterium sp.]THD58666.1 MAG: hypothetical protein E8A49_19300 [Phenylobacterium sp.]